jgi:2-amino-4-hydroxy-6-hydroxymethyldihydropteridine diphosphokinase
MTVAYLGLGANLGDARQCLKDAVVSLAQRPGVIVLAKSPLYRSAPIDAEGGDFYNYVVAVGTLLPARQLLELCMSVEHEFGRERPYQNAPRTLDIDILLYGDDQFNDADLIIPHPRLTQRAFALMPLLDLDADVVIPGRGRADQFQADVADQVIDVVATCQCPAIRGVSANRESNPCP